MDIYDSLTFYITAPTAQRLKCICRSQTKKSCQSSNFTLMDTTAVNEIPDPLHGVTDRIILKPEIDPFGSEAIKKCRLRAKSTSFPENRWRWLEKVPVESIADLAHHYWTCTRPHHSLRIASCYTQWLSLCIFSYFGICGLHGASYKIL